MLGIDRINATPKMELSLKTPRSVELDVLNTSPAAHDNSGIYF